jgi:hypothetical protein
MNRTKWHLSLSMALILLLASNSSYARNDNASWIAKMKDSKERVWVLNGSCVHNVGNLQMNVTNWGCLGSYPSSEYSMSEAPSAQWPANSGVEYLYIAGIWVGAKKGGVPVVTTAAYEQEFSPDPTDDEVRIYRSFEGIAGGSRYPTTPDDDRDGSVDEDWLNGKDDDGDGKIDEDYAAISKQMYTCWFRDDYAYTMQRYPEHTPLHLMVRQESYQWEEEKFYNFVGVEYKIKNDGTENIEDVYIGFFADSDCGPRSRDEYWLDDGVGLYEGIVCAQKGDRSVPVRISCAYVYDVDGDEGLTPGYFGVLFLGHDIDPMGETAPKSVGITSYQNFSGDQPYENGGDPENDYQRYELLSKTVRDRNQDVGRDYRFMMATGPFRELAPESTLVLQVAFVCGQGLDGMKSSAANAAMTYDGNWFDIDGNSLTGVDGCETPVYGPVSGIIADSCKAELTPQSATRGEIIWVNSDCSKELALWNDTSCPKGDAEFADYQTGVEGKEYQVNWLVGSAPPPPVMRIIAGDEKVTLLWDNFSEMSPDVSTLEYDFEGYRIWRADGWGRPYGTSVLTGPSRELWQLLEERDLMNGLAPDIDFKKPYEEGGWEYSPLRSLGNPEAYLVYFEQNLYYYPMDKVPCPPGLSDVQCDTLETMARYNLGYEGGLQYYKFVDTSVHNGMHYFYGVTAYDHVASGGEVIRVGFYGDPASNFLYVTPLSDAQEASTYKKEDICVVPNPASRISMEPWQLEPNNDDPTGIKVEFRNLPKCRSTVRIYSVAGDLVQTLFHDGSAGNGSLPWDLVSRNGQDVTSGIYLFAVEPEDGRFERTIGKFVVIR